MNKEFPGRNIRKGELGPGVWVDADDCVHFDIGEILDHLKMPRTRENQELVRSELQAIHASIPGHGPLIHRHPETEKEN